VREDAEDVAHVLLGLEVVELGRRDDREQVRRRLCVVVAADEEPVLATVSAA
jgi:hypothetical protein